MSQEFQKQEGERGSALVEFVLSSLVWLPVLLGTAVFGINLVYSIGVSALSRDSGHMYAYGVDFTQTANQSLLLNLASGLGITASGGPGAVMLSTVTLVTPTDCGTAACGNRGKYVFTQIIVFGNRSLIKTTLGAPPISSIGSSGVLAATPAQYLDNANFVASAFPGLLAFPSATQSGQVAYVSEVFLNSQTIDWNAFSNTGSYARTIF